MKARKIKAIIVEPYHNRKIAEKVAQSTGAKVIDFAQFPGALPNTDTYVKLIDALVNNLAAALQIGNYMWEVMFWPIVACVLLPWLLVYLGLHVVRRGIIFIDIAMAQMASLGICVAVLLHLNLESWPAFCIALGFTLAWRRDFFRYRQTHESDPAGSDHRHQLCRGGGGGRPAPEPRRGRR